MKPHGADSFKWGRDRDREGERGRKGTDDGINLIRGTESPNLIVKI